jgi:hypothetical protein
MMLFFVFLKEYLLCHYKTSDSRDRYVSTVDVKVKKKYHNGGVSNDIISKRHQGGFIILMSTTESGYEGILT